MDFDSDNQSKTFLEINQIIAAEHLHAIFADCMQYILRDNHAYRYPTNRMRCNARHVSIPRNILRIPLFNIFLVKHKIIQGLC